MHSGDHWVSTDYYCNQRQTFIWSATIHKASRTATIHWHMTTKTNDGRGPTYYVCRGNQVLKVQPDGKGDWKTVVNTDSTYSHNGHTVYRGFTDEDSWLDNHRNLHEFFDTNGDYTGIRRWVKILGSSWESGSFTVHYNDEGKAKFRVEGSFGWYTDTRRTFSITFHLKRIEKESYTIKYNLNRSRYGLVNQSKSVSATTKKYGEVGHISKTIPKSDSHTFVGWSTKSNDSKIEYKAGGIIAKSTNKNMTLYAVWKPKTFTYTFDLQGGEFLDSSLSTEVKATFGKQVLFPSFKKTGYTSQNWRATDTGDLYSQGSYITVSSVKDRTFVAQYLSNRYTITLIDSLTNNVVRTISAVYGLPVTGDFTYEKAGYTLEGWTDSAHIKSFLGDESLHPFTMEDNVDDLLVIKAGSYSSSTTPRTSYNYASNVTLYAVYTYLSTFYVKTESGWKLALPYVKTDSGWKVTLGYVKDSDDKWKI